MLCCRTPAGHRIIEPRGQETRERTRCTPSLSSHTSPHITTHHHSPPPFASLSTQPTSTEDLASSSKQARKCRQTGKQASKQSETQPPEEKCVLSETCVSLPSQPEPIPLRLGHTHTSSFFSLSLSLSSSVFNVKGKTKGYDQSISTGPNADIHPSISNPPSPTYLPSSPIIPIPSKRSSPNGDNNRVKTPSRLKSNHYPLTHSLSLPHPSRFPLLPPVPPRIASTRQ
ncbi:hypothetical protein B0T16DRAFT_407003 [Cercophora newfieldiana]|uniref:Uncharacterized protein n=1 Tax=Cercophora newfieldiana TaxID=92897 RepID=A0AA40CVA7_9PEZI|nr:hypothetical protein B0T16DRAFT_407003 [Cercophora newfieldiana]